jgi:hypothetical protein
VAIARAAALPQAGRPSEVAIRSACLACRGITHMG